MRSGSPLFVKIDATMPSLEATSDELTDSASPITPEDEQPLSWPENAAPVATPPAVIRIKAAIPIRSAPIVIPKPVVRRPPPGPSPLGRAKPLLAADLDAEARPARGLQLICDERRADAVVRLEKFATRRSKVAPRANWQAMKAEVPPLDEPCASALRIKTYPRRVDPNQLPLVRRTAGAIQVNRRYQELLMMQLFF